jgi:hypothetical protein
MEKKRTKKKQESPNPPEPNHEPSMAELMIDAELSRAMGEPVEDWLSDMLTDEEE